MKLGRFCTATNRMTQQAQPLPHPYIDGIRELSTWQAKALMDGLGMTTPSAAVKTLKHYRRKVQHYIEQSSVTISP
jgi:hypothetical protein